jgi:hypothetical protein
VFGNSGFVEWSMCDAPYGHQLFLPEWLISLSVDFWLIVFGNSGFVD